MLDGTSQTIAGSTTFYDLTKTVAGADTLTFTAGTTQSIATGGTLTLAGASGNLLSLRSSSEPTDWNLIVDSGGGNYAIDYVNVKDSDASGGKTIYPYYSADAAPGSTNTNWIFPNLQLVKQVWNGGTCLASQPADAGCSTSATTASVPAGTTVSFLIYIKNTLPVQAKDVRFLDVLDVTATGFDYVANSLHRDDGTLADTATIADIYNATKAPGDGGTGVLLTDGVDGDIGSVCDSGAGGCPGVTLDRVSVGNTAGLTPAQTNGSLTYNANKTFAVLFKAIKK